MEVPGWGAVTTYARRLGWRRTLLRGAYVAANQLMRLSIYDAFRLEPADVDPERARVDGGFDCRFLAADEAAAVGRQLDAAFASALTAALARGDAAYAILDGDTLASIGLYAAGPTPLDDLQVRFAPPARYMYRGYTPAAYRGRRLHAVGILRAAAELFARGVPRLVTVCERTNFPATISVHRMGWRPAGTLYRIGLGRYSRIGSSAPARALGMELASTAAAPRPL